MKIKSIFVLGSTSLIAQELCLDLAKKGCSRFHLISRDLIKNKPLKEILTKKYNAFVTEELINLAETDPNNLNLPEIENFDLYLITAGNLGDNLKAQTNLSETNSITRVNYTSLLPWLLSIANDDRLNTKSSLWIFSSVAADRGRPSNFVYGAAKAGLSVFCEGLIAKSQGKPFSIRLIKAGFMMTPMSEGKAPKFLCIKPKTVVKYLLKNTKKHGTEYLPWWWFIIMKIIKLLPLQIIKKL